MVDLLPVVVVQQLIPPAMAETHVEEIRPFVRQEGRYVHAISDVRKRILFGRHLRPRDRRDAGGDVAVDARDAVTEARSAKRELRLVETALARRRGAEREELLRREA